MNCVDMTGQTWRYIRTFAIANGVRILRVPGSTKSFVVAAELFAALERVQAAEHDSPEPEPAVGDELAAMREKLGLRRIGGRS